MTSDETLLVAKGIDKVFGGRSSWMGRRRAGVRALTDVSVALRRGETLGVVGETGCGKSTLGRTLAGLVAPTDGDVWFDGRRVFELSAAQRRDMRRDLQLVFQDPYSSLNPRYTIGRTVAEPLEVHGLAEDVEAQVADLLSVVGLDPRYARRYPYELSGGMRQRVGIARAIATGPQLIICDEPVSALDVSIQGQVLNLLLDLQQSRGFGYVFITHDLTVAKHISDRVAVMYLGRIVELTTTADLFGGPLHPYSQALMSAIPVPDPGQQRLRERIVLRGELPSPSNQPPGCAFQTRCPMAMDICRTTAPPLAAPAGTPEHFVACHLHNEPDVVAGLYRDLVELP